MAARNLRDPDLETVLRRWWVKKYKLPWTHSLAQEATYAELLVEFYEDYFEEKPEEARKALAKGGEFYFESTGDPMIDKWERELAAGVTPDLTESYSPEERARRRAKKAQVQKAKEVAKDVEFDDDYTKPSTLDPRLQAKVVPAGSQEEHDLRATSRKAIPQVEDDGMKLLRDRLIGAR